MQHNIWRAISSTILILKRLTPAILTSCMFVLRGGSSC